MKVTLDSNVWEEVVRPDTRPGNAKRQQQLFRIHEAIKSQQIDAYICDSVATLEGLRKQDRGVFFAQQEVRTRVAEFVQPDGSTNTGALMVPDQSHRPALKPVLTDRLEKAVELGIRIMGVPRYSDLVFPPACYADESAGIAASVARLLREIEDRGFGMAPFRTLGLKLAVRNAVSEPFFDIPNVTLTKEDEVEIANAVAEWADGDAIACHIGYGNDVFCSGDKGGKKGTRHSILNFENRQWLQEAHNVQFKTVEELADLITNDLPPDQ
jgi:hypothetical protein